MSKTLGGAFFVWNGVKQDYSFIESLDCLYDMCDEISIIFGGDDGTVESIQGWLLNYIPFDKKIHWRIISTEEWFSQKGREKLSYFSNMAIEALTTDYFYYQQADEITHESSFPFIRQAIETDQEAFLIHRINLWHSAYTGLNVSQDRLPVSNIIIRLAKKQYRCVDDAESVMAQASTDFINHIRMYHVGFVRDKDKHLVKLKHMQEEVFLFDKVDQRIHDCPNGFDAWKWGFGPSDLIQIPEPLPKFIKKWADERLVDPFQDTEEGIRLATEWLQCKLDMNSLDSIKDQKSLLKIANDFWWVMAKCNQ